MRYNCLTIPVSVVLLCAVPGALFASTTGGNKRVLPMHKWSLGVNSEWSDRVATRFDNRELKSDIRQFRSFFKAEYGLTDLFNFYGLVGGGIINIEDRRGVPRTSRHSNIGPLWGGGGKYRLYISPGGGELDLEGTYIRQSNTQYTNIVGRQKTITDEWQGQTVFSQPHGRFLPYFGLKYSYYRVKIDRDVSESFHQTSPNYFGLILGGEWKFSNRLKVFAEGRFVDENAASIGLYWILN